MAPVIEKTAILSQTYCWYSQRQLFFLNSSLPVVLESCAPSLSKALSHPLLGNNAEDKQLVLRSFLLLALTHPSLKASRTTLCRVTNYLTRLTTMHSTQALQRQSCSYLFRLSLPLVSRPIAHFSTGNDDLEIVISEPLPFLFPRAPFLPFSNLGPPLPHMT